MTGRRLYDLYCDAFAQRTSQVWDGHQWVPRECALAWPELTSGERQMWSRIAARVKGVKR